MSGRLIIISGPTASGKTKTSIEIAKHIEQMGLLASVVNFDSLLFYKELSIGTAKPTIEERQGVDHHMIDITSITTPINVAAFISKCEQVILDLFKQDRVVILVGGSAFYLRALLKGMYDTGTPSPELKNRIDEQYKNEGITPFVEYLKIHDPESLVNLHPNDHYRLMRAVEHFEASGKKISEQKKELDGLNPYDFSSIIHPWKIFNIYLDLPKDEHYDLIVKRTREMFDQGLFAEIEEVEKLGLSLEDRQLPSIGYKEAMDFKKGLFANLDQCIERIAISTRQLAKAQRTFFKKITPKESFNPVTDQAKIKTRVECFLKDEK